MDRYALEHVATSTLVNESKQFLKHERRRTADLIARFAEIDRRAAYAEAHYSSMHAFCVSEFGLDDGEAFRRITAARYALKFPALFQALADERLHLTAIITIGPHLTPANVDELIAAATHKTRRQIEEMLVARKPKSDLPERVRRLPVAATVPHGKSLPRVESATEGTASHLDEPTLELAPARVMSSPAKVTPLAPARFGLQVTIGQGTHDKLRRAQELMGHTTRTGDVATVLDRALDALITQLEKRKLAATSRPRGRRRLSNNPRHIPAHVKRAVRARDGDRCAFVAMDGLRCESRSPLEFDHIVPVARGGTSTIANVRQLCRTHNRLEAERMFGREFMRRKIAMRGEETSSSLSGIGP